MADVASRELRNDTGQVLRRVEAGEQVTITVDGRPVALLRPLGARQRWLSRQDFTKRVLEGRRQADVGLRKELAELAPDTTDDLLQP